MLAIAACPVPMLTIREGDPRDAARCAALPAHYTTREVWQLQPTRDARADVVHYAIHLVRLPRARTMHLPSARVPLAASWHTFALRLVAERDDDLCGFLTLHQQPERERALLAHLLVASAMRGQGIGGLLLNTARTWVELERLSGIDAYVPPRNVPGMRFLCGRGFRQCGFIERYYTSGEDALVLALDL